jgi:hypothetical protein
MCSPGDLSSPLGASPVSRSFVPDEGHDHPATSAKDKARSLVVLVRRAGRRRLNRLPYILGARVGSRKGWTGVAIGGDG